MNAKHFLRALSVTVLTLALILGGSILFKPTPAAAPGQSVALKAPPFLAADSAAAAPSAIGDKLDAEAGISAWYKASAPLNLTQFRNSGIVTTCELETADYLICSVDVTNYSEAFDTHVYAHKDGWILAYFLKTHPTAKMVDVKSESLNGTILRNVVASVAAAGGVPFTEVNYYDFRYPNATHILIVGENYDGGDYYTIQLPVEYSYFEYSWSVFCYYQCHFQINGANMPRAFEEDAVAYGVIPASQLLPGTTYWVNTGRYGALVITYRMP